MMTVEPIRTMAVCYWSPYLALALVDGDAVRIVETPRMPRGPVQRSALERRASRFLTRHFPELVILESRTAKALGLAPRGGVLRVMSVSDAKDVLAPESPKDTHEYFLRHLQAEFGGDATQACVPFRRRRMTAYAPRETVKLLAFGLALAGWRHELRAVHPIDEPDPQLRLPI